MEVEPSLEYLCRVCAANTKGRNSVAECVYILKTAGLQEKIEKYLYLHMNEHDSLPKVLCKTCFRQVEATASLSKIARHTQKVFGDYLTTSAKANSLQTQQQQQRHVAPHGEFTPILLIGGTAMTRATATESSRPPPISAMSCSSPPPLVAVGGPMRRDEVVVNVSVADPLTRETQEKMILASQRKQLQVHRTTVKSNEGHRSYSVSPRRRHEKQQTFIRSCSFGENKEMTHNSDNQTSNDTTSNEKELAHQKRRSQKTMMNNAAQNGQVSLLKVSQQKHHQQQQQQPEGVTDLKAIDAQMKIARLEQTLRNIYGNVAIQKHPENKSHQHNQNPQCRLVNLYENEGYVAGDEEVLPQRIIIAAAKTKKRDREKKRDATTLLAPPPPPLHTQSKVESIPIVSSPQWSDTEASAPTQPAAASPQGSFPEDIMLGRVIKDPDLLKLILKALKWPVTSQTMPAQMATLRNSRFADIMSDPNLLQDTDLTQLLGPYLAPVLLASQLLQQQQQQQQMAATAAHQISGQKTRSPSPITTINNPHTMKSTEDSLLGGTIPYKLPPETSVQLVPASPPQTDRNMTKETSSSSPPLVSILKESVLTTQKTKRVRIGPEESIEQRRRNSAAETIILSDDEGLKSVEPTVVIPNSNSSNASSKQSPDIIPNFQIELDAAYVSKNRNPFSGAGETANEALLALLKRQKAALRRQTKINVVNKQRLLNDIQKLKEDELDLDDIILMEQQNRTTQILVPTVVHTPAPLPAPVPAPTRAQSKDVSVNTAAIKYSHSSRSNFLKRRYSTATVPTKSHISTLNTKLDPPPITRPIIKRRKTAVQTSPINTEMNLNKSTSMTPPVQQQNPIDIPLNTMDTISKTSMSIVISESSSPTTNQATQVPSALLNKVTQIPSVTTVSTTVLEMKRAQMRPQFHKEYISDTSLMTTTCHTISDGNLRPNTKKMSSSKSTLGQQLLQAVGLQKVTGESDVAGGDNCATSDSVHQIRTALKQQLKRAQEQRRIVDTDNAFAEESTDKIPIATTVTRSVAAIIQDADSTTKSTNSSNKEDNEEEQKPKDSKRIDSISTGRRSTVERSARNTNKDDIEEEVHEQKGKEATIREGELEKKLQQPQTPHTNTNSDHSNAEKVTSTASSYAKQSINATPQRKSVRNRISDFESGRQTHEPMRPSSIRLPRGMSSRTKSTDKDTIKTGNEVKNTSRPARVSKTLSRYYKGPEEHTSSTLSRTPTLTSGSVLNRREIPIRNVRFK